MDSIVGFDPTLPIDLDGSANPDLLPEVTFGNHLEYQDGSIPMVTKQNNGRRSPIRARTMKEYDQQIAELKKENFSLKLRIYFLEERMQQKFGDGEDVFKTNIELKVQVESLKKELIDKQELLKKASTAMESMTINHEIELNQIHSQVVQDNSKEAATLSGELKEALDKVRHLEGELGKVMTDLQDAKKSEHRHSQDVQELKQLLDSREKDIVSLSDDLDGKGEQVKELDVRLTNADSEKEELQERLDQLQKEIDRRDRDVLHLSSALKEAKVVDSESFLAQNRLQDVVDDQKEDLDKLQGRLDDLQGQVKDKDGTIGVLEDALKDKEKKNKDLENKLRQLEKEVSRLSENGTKRDTTIRGLVASIHEKNRETKALENHVQNSDEEIKKLKDDLHAARQARHQAEEALHVDNDGRNAKIARLEQNLHENELQLENLMRALGKKDGELVNFKDLLNRVEDSLKQSEKAVEALQQQLQKERDHAEDKLEGQAQQFKHLIEDAKAELKRKGEFIATLESRLKDKDKQLEEYVQLLSGDDQGSQSGLYKALADREKELQALRKKLADRGPDDQGDLAARLKDAEAALEALDVEGHAKDMHIQQLTGKLRTAQMEIEAALDAQSRAVEEKRTAIRRLEGILADRDAALQDALDYNTGDGNHLKLLREQLKEKDKLLEELMAEKNRIVLENGQASRDFIHKLKEKNASTDDMKLYKLLEEQLQEIRHLSDLLGKEKQIFITLNQDGGGISGNPRDSSSADQDRSAAFLTELGAVQALRQQLQEGVERNNNLRLVLEHQISGQIHTPAAEQARGQAEHQGAGVPAASPRETKPDSTALVTTPVDNRSSAYYNRSKYSPSQDGDDVRSRLHYVDVQTSPVRFSISPGESGYHEIADVQSSPRSRVTSRGRAVSIYDHGDYSPEQYVPMSRRGHVVDGSTSPLAQSVVRSPRISHHSVQTSPGRVSTAHKSTLTSPHSQSIGTSPSVPRHLCLSPAQRSGTSTNDASVHFSSSPRLYADVQTSPVSSLNSSLSPTETLSSGLGSLPDPESLSKMSSSMLRKLVQQLQEDLVAALKQNHQLQDQVFGECETREIPGRNDTDPTVADFQHMQEEIDKLQSSLEKKEKENEILKSHLGVSQNTVVNSRELPYLHDLQNEVQKLTSQLNDILKANELLKKQINLSSRSPDNPSGFNPCLIIEMAKEIESLKAELERSRKCIAEYRTFETQSSESQSTSEPQGLNTVAGDFHNIDVTTGKGQSSKGSQIPRPKMRPMKTPASQDLHPVILQKQLVDAQDHINQLEKKLRATEETVRCQSQKVKYYRGLLGDAGIVSLLDSRSQSETCLARTSPQKSFHGSVDNLSPGKNSQDGQNVLKALSLESIKDYGTTDNVYELKHQIKDMQSKLEKSLTLVHRYHSQSSLGSTEQGLNVGRRSRSPVTLNGRRNHSADSRLGQAGVCIESVQHQVQSLQQELEESRRINSDLQAKLKELQKSSQLKKGLLASHIDPQAVDVEAYTQEVCDLRRELQNSQNMNTMLKDELEEVSLFLSELMVHDQNGHSTSAVSLNDIGSIRNKLNQSLDILRTTQSDLSLYSPRPVHDMPASIRQSLSDTVLQGKYHEALHSNQQLRQQLSQLQEMYHQDLQQQKQEVRQLQRMSNRFQMEIDKKSVDADGSPKGSKRLSGSGPLSSKAPGDTEDLDSSSPSDGVPHPAPCLPRLSGGLCKSGSMESDDIADVHKQTDENYGMPMNGSGTELSVERLRHPTGSVDSPERDVVGGEVDSVQERLRLRTGSSATTDHRSLPSMDNQYNNDISVFVSPKVPNTSVDIPSRFSMKVSESDFSHYGRQSLGPKFCDIILNPSSEGRAEEAQDWVDSSGTLSRKSIFKSDTDSILVSSRERSQTPLTDVSQLQARLGAMEDLNKTLKGELSIYETLCKSVGIQNSPGKLHGDPKSPSRLDMDSLTLREHLAEIRAMRMRLEKGLEQSDKMREELFHKLDSTAGSGSCIHHECDQKLYELEKMIVHLQQELAGKTSDISEKVYIIDEHEKVIHDTRVIIERQRRVVEDKELIIEKLRKDLSDMCDVCERQKKEIVEKEETIEQTRTDLSRAEDVLEKHQREMSEKEKTISRLEKTLVERDQVVSETESTTQQLRQKKEKMEGMLKKASKEIKRLNLEVDGLKDRAEEKTELNKTLRLELSVYEKLNGEQQENDEKSCIRELLSEMRCLRIQLERSINANDTLRNKLEEILRHQQQQQQRHSHSPSGSHSTDAPDGRPSPEVIQRPGEKSKTKETVIRKYRSEKEYKYNVMTRDAGLHEEAAQFHSDVFSTTDTRSAPTSDRHTSSCSPIREVQKDSENSPVKEIHLSRSLPVKPGSSISDGNSMMSLPDDLGQVPERRHLASVENIKYWVDSHPTAVMKDFPIVRVDSDLRRLFAVGKLDDFEKLRKENNESVSTLCSIQTRVSERLKTLKSLSTSENLEYSTLKELSMSAENLRICLTEENRLISAFWVSQLPPINELGEFFDPKMASENDDLKRNLIHLRSKYDLLKHQVREADHRLLATNKQRENVEKVLYTQLSKTYKVLQKAGSNMEKSARESGFKVPSSTKR